MTKMVKLQQRRGLSRAGRQISSGMVEQCREKCAVVWVSNGALSVNSSFNPSRVAKSKGWCNAGERHGRRGVGYDRKARAAGLVGSHRGGRTMTEAELLALRSVLADRRCVLLDHLAVALLDRLAITVEDGNLPAGQVIEPGFLRLLADLHTTIAAVDAVLAESATTGDAQ